jgi:toxin FitB
MILLNSSVWIYFFMEGPEAQSAVKYLGDLSEVITPVIVLYEIYNKIKRDRSEEEALQAVSLMLKTTVIPIEESLALFAADVYLNYSPPMVDVLGYAVSD